MSNEQKTDGVNDLLLGVKSLLEKMSKANQKGGGAPYMGEESFIGCLWCNRVPHQKDCLVGIYIKRIDMELKKEKI